MSVFLRLFYLFDHAEGERTNSIGQISSLPKSIATDSTSFAVAVAVMDQKLNIDGGIGGGDGILEFQPQRQERILGAGAQGGENYN